MEPVLLVNVRLDESTVVRDGMTEVRFLRFHGSSASKYFRGTILPGAVDTQLCSDGRTILSARYILEGEDYTGQRCRVFIENNGCDTGDGLQTRPKVITDSQALREILSGELYGKAEGAEGVVVISIYRQ